MKVSVISAASPDVWWGSVTSENKSSKPSIEGMQIIWGKISSVIQSLLKDIENDNEYWQLAEAIVKSISPEHDCPPPITNFSEFIDHIYSIREILIPQNPQEVIPYITASNKADDAMYLMWDFNPALQSPYLFINSMNKLVHMRSVVNNRLASHETSMDYIFDHYYPLLETLPLTQNDDAIVARINLFSFLARLITHYSERLRRFDDFHRLLWNRLLRIQKNSSMVISIAAFRVACELYRATMDKMTPPTQAAWMLKLITNNPDSSPLHLASIRFAMWIRPQDFGFVTLCKTLIQQGITDQRDIGHMARILRLPCVKNPTDVFQYLFETATTHKYLANAASKVILKPLLKFKELPDLKTWLTLFVKRSFQFVAFAADLQKYNRRIFLIIRLYKNILALNIDWLTKLINTCANTVLSLGKCEELLKNRFEPTTDIDQKMKEEIETTPKEKVNMKSFLLDVRTIIPLIDIKSDSEPNSGRPSAKKPSVAEARAKFLAQRQNQVDDLDVLANLPPPPK